jgi:hypothetical protein
LPSGAWIERIAMASTVTVTVPPDQGDAVLDRLLALYQAQAEALHVATLAYLGDRRSLEPVLEHRDELAEIEALIDLAGWRFGPRVATLELVGPPGLVREAVYATLVDAAKAVVRDIDRYERGELELDELRARSRAADVLLVLFARLEEAAG